MRSASPQRKVASLPITARGLVAAALGLDDPAEFAVRRFRVVNAAQDFRGAFTPGGVTVTSGAGRLRLQLFGYGRRALFSMPAVSPMVSVNRVTYRWPGVSEWFANGPLGLEQGFTVARAPRTNSSPLTLAVGLTGNLTPRLRGGAVTLTGHGTSMSYGGLVATDARGHTLRSWMTLAGGRILIHVSDAGAEYPVRIDPFLQQGELNGSSANYFGSAVAVSGNMLFVGAPNEMVTGHTDAGAVHVFAMGANGWADATQTAVITDTPVSTDGWFGAAVAASGNTLAVGEPYAGSGKGAVVVYTEPADGWASTEPPTATLTASAATSNANVGGSLAVSGDTILAGAPGESSGTGAGYIFTMPGTGWTTTGAPDATLTASDSVSSLELGFSAALSDNTAVLGTYDGATLGRAYVYSEPGGGWTSHTQTAELTDGNDGTNDRFGYSVAVDADTIAVGVPNSPTSHVDVYVAPSGTWSTTAAPTAVLALSSSLATAPALGDSVAVSGNTIVAGAPQQDVGSSGQQGAVYSFLMPGGGWHSGTQAQELTAGDGATNDGLGYDFGPNAETSLAISGDEIFAGARSHSSNAGAVYVFTRPGPTATITTPVSGAVYAQGQSVGSDYGCADAVDGSGLASCTGSVSSGAAIDTSPVGAHTFTVTATDNAGVATEQSVSYSVEAPRASGVAETRPKWRTSDAIAKIAKHNGNQVPTGTRFLFTMNVEGTVDLSFERKTTGRRSRGRCLAEKRSNRSKPRCTRAVSAGSLSFPAGAGTHSVTFDGLTASGKLGRGRYSVTIGAVGQPSPTTLSFTIVE